MKTITLALLETLFCCGIAASAAQAQAPCCTITGLVKSPNTYTAKINATGQTFTFAVTGSVAPGPGGKNTVTYRSVSVGQAIYANLTAKQVSFDGKTPGGTITAISAAPTASPTTPALKSAASAASTAAAATAAAAPKLGSSAATTAATATQADTVLTFWVTSNQFTVSGEDLAFVNCAPFSSGYSSISVDVTKGALISASLTACGDNYNSYVSFSFPYSSAPPQQPEPGPVFQVTASRANTPSYVTWLLVINPPANRSAPGGSWLNFTKQSGTVALPSLGTPTPAPLSGMVNAELGAGCLNTIPMSIGTCSYSVSIVLTLSTVMPTAGSQ